VEQQDATVDVVSSCEERELYAVMFFEFIFAILKDKKFHPNVKSKEVISFP